jgi:hypothetical protein
MRILSQLPRTLAWALVGSLAASVGCGGAGNPGSSGAAPQNPQGVRTDSVPGPNVTTFRNDISRSGAYLAETQLTPANVNTHTFGKLYERAVQGDVYAQPLYVRNVPTAAGNKNLVYVATSTNDVYAFDADNTSTDPWAGRVWHHNLNPWRPLVINNEICAETVGSVGITSTPVIDVASQTMYVVTRRSGGRIVASGGDLYQLHNSGLIWKFTPPPPGVSACSGTPQNCPYWQLLDTNPNTVQITASFSSPGLFQLHRTGAVWNWTGSTWQQIGNDPHTVRIEAAGVSGGMRLAQLREDGSIHSWTQSGNNWTLDDTNPATTQIAVGTTIGGTIMYQLHNDGSIWQQTGAGVPGWTMLDDNPATVQIVAAGGDVYQLHNTGKIWKYLGQPCNGRSCPSWEMIDDNPATVQIAAAPKGVGVSGSTLYQMHNTGLIWRWKGDACTGNSCPSWELLDNNGRTAQIVVDNTSDILYQVHYDGTIWKSTGDKCGSWCAGWTQLDNNWALNDGANYLHAINIADGSERMPPVHITATDPNNGNIHFDSRCQRNRPALLLLNGVVYVAFGTFSCDGGAPDGSGPYHGWVMGYRTSDLAQVATFDTSPDGAGAGIWQSGGGLVGAPDGSIFFETGNDFDSGVARLGDSFVKLKAQAASPGLIQAGVFTPNDFATLRHGDTDLGSGGPMLLPGGRIVGGGKQGRYYVLDQTTFKPTQNITPDANGFDGFQAFINTWHPEYTIQHYADGELFGPNIHTGPVYFSGTNFIYEMPEKDFLKGFQYNPTTGVLGTTPAVTASGSWSRARDGMPGGFSSVSANGNTNGIVWTSLPQSDGQWHKVPGALAAFDATSLTQIWVDDSQQSFAKFNPPMIADGKVYRATFASDVHHGVYGKIIVYGLHPFTPSPVQPQIPDGQTARNPIDEAYWQRGGQLGMLGLPVSEEQDAAGGGRFRDFRSTQKSGRLSKAKAGAVFDAAVYWSPATGAHVVSGDILALWRKLGAEKSVLGYPTSEETNAEDATGRVSHFQHGDIVWHQETGAVVQLTQRHGRLPASRMRAPR